MREKRRVKSLLESVVRVFSGKETEVNGACRQRGSRERERNIIYSIVDGILNVILRLNSGGPFRELYIFLHRPRLTDTRLFIF